MIIPQQALNNTCEDFKECFCMPIIAMDKTWVKAIISNKLINPEARIFICNAFPISSTITIHTVCTK